MGCSADASFGGNGTTSFAINGQTQTAATVSFATEPDGSTTIDNKALNADGTLANETILTTTQTATGINRQLQYDTNGDGQIDRTQYDNTTTIGGVTTEVVSNTDGSGTLLNGTSTATSTAGGVTTVTILRNQTGAIVNGALVPLV